jgi:hypothetical protein
MDQLDSRAGARGVLELPESQHRPEARLDVAVILLNDIVEILARADRDGPQLSILGPKLAKGPMGAWYPSGRSCAAPVLETCVEAQQLAHQAPPFMKGASNICLKVRFATEP